MKTFPLHCLISSVSARACALCLTMMMFVYGNANAQVPSLPYYGSSDFTPYWLEASSPKLRDFHRIPNFQFTNQEGNTITESAVAGKIFVASFFFSTCPGICPMLRSKLSAVQDKFIDDQSVIILSHSIRPATDTVEVLQAYAKQNNIKPGKWHLLTGDRDDIYNLARHAYFADEDLGNPNSNSDFLHTENLLLIDQDRRIRGVYNGLSSSSVGNLITDIQVLQQEPVMR